MGGGRGNEFLNFFLRIATGSVLYRETERDRTRDIARMPVTRLSTEFLFQRFGRPVSLAGSIDRAELRSSVHRFPATWNQ